MSTTQDLSRVADIITRTWHDATDLARQVIEDPRFPSTVRAIIEAEHNGLDIAELLAQVPRDTLAAVREKARYAAHAVRVAASAHAQPGRGWDPYPADDPTWHLDGAADVLREAWREHPDAAEKVVTGPGFDLLADRMAHAQQAGLDAAALLETIDPDKIAAADVPSPAGITAAALTRAAAEAQIPAWTEREYGHLTDETLADELTRARQRLDAAVAGRAAAAEEARLLAEAAAAGRGPAVTRLEQEMAELHRTAEELARHSALEADLAQRHPDRTGRRRRRIARRTRPRSTQHPRPSAPRRTRHPHHRTPPTTDGGARSCGHRRGPREGVDPCAA